jgi:hypothetical protein
MRRNAFKGLAARKEPGCAEARNKQRGNSCDDVQQSPLWMSARCRMACPDLPRFR